MRYDQYMEEVKKSNLNAQRAKKRAGIQEDITTAEKKMKLVDDTIQTLRKEADQLAKDAEKKQDFTLLSKSNAFRKKATEKQEEHKSLKKKIQQLRDKLKEMLLADFTSATILISFGAVLGKTSPLQLILMAFFEVIFSLVNEFIAVEYLGTTDIGGSMYVHTFGAYFGLSVSLLVTRQAGRESPKEGAVYHSDLFAMIGTLFLWIFWPSFNSALGDDDQRHRAVLNTYFSLAACCVTTFAISSLLSKKGKFDMVHVQNATLAGGVAVGTAANLMIQPWGAILIGVVAGVLSTFGYKVIQPFLCEKFGLHDTCGVHNLHGMPGILGGLGGIVACALASEAVYGDSLPDVFGDRFEDPPADSTAKAPIEVRDAGQQALMQLAALVMTLAIAIVSGLFTGLILRCVPGLDALSDEKVFEDEYFWEEVEAADSSHATTGYHMVQQRAPAEVEAEEGTPHTETYTKNGKQEGEAQV
ncbi:ammonium transporter Rh type A-like [Lytechinus pictus]|uniref:ammonium transporter Rh type A-like n=1 Tax=Lytechinus pictus TaxID=7653 RepID=UPI0030B9AF2B